MTRSDADYGTTQDDALRALDDGLPVLLPRANRWRSVMLDHRWGEHGEHPYDCCPACNREQEARRG